LISHSQGQVQRPVIEDVRQPFAEGSLSVLFHVFFFLTLLFFCISLCCLQLNPTFVYYT
jgi:hypothetical protein